MAKPVRRRWLVLGLLGSAVLAGQTVGRSPLASVSPARNRWIGTGPAESSVTRIVPVFSSDDVVYCIADNKVFKTRNAGDLWFPLDLQPGIADVAIDPSDSRVILAATLGTPSIVLKSTDAGETWSPRGIPASVFGAKRILWDGGRPNRVFLVAFNAVIRSLDTGESWDFLTPPVPGSVAALALDSISGALYAASSVGILRLDIDASSWVQLSEPFQTGPVIELDIDPIRPNFLYAITGGGFPRVYASRDGGRTWTTPELEIGSPGVTTLAVDPQHPDVLYGASSGYAIVRSQDGGVSWADYSSGLYLPGTQNSTVRALALGPTGTLFAGTTPGFLGLQSGVFRRRIDDPIWNLVNTGLPRVGMRLIATDASPRSTVYAASAGLPAAVWTSEDAGMTWSLSPLDIRYEGSSVLVTDKLAPGTAYFGTSGCAPRPPYPCYGTLWKTTDRGEHWEGLPVPSDLGSVEAIGVDPTRPQILYAAGHASGYVGVRSADGGGSWKHLTNGFPNGVSRFLVDSRAPDSVYVATGNGVFKSPDGGASWGPTGLGDATVTALAQDARRGILYAGSDLGLFRSDDAGANWTLRVLPEGVQALAIDSRSGFLYAATKNGIRESLDGGQTWSAVGSSLSGVSVYDITLSSDGSILYAATNGGVYIFEFRRPRAVGSR